MSIQERITQRIRSQQDLIPAFAKANGVQLVLRIPLLAIIITLVVLTLNLLVLDNLLQSSRIGFVIFITLASEFTIALLLSPLIIYDLTFGKDYSSIVYDYLTNLYFSSGVSYLQETGTIEPVQQDFFTFIRVLFQLVEHRLIAFPTLLAFLVVLLFISYILLSILSTLNLSNRSAILAFFSFTFMLILANGSKLIEENATLTSQGTSLFDFFTSIFVWTAIMSYTSLEVSLQINFFNTIYFTNRARGEEISKQVENIINFDSTVFSSQNLEGTTSLNEGESSNDSEQFDSDRPAKQNGSTDKYLSSQRKLQRFYLEHIGQSATIKQELIGDHTFSGIWRSLLILIGISFFRLILLTFITWLFINPKGFLETLRFPGSITNSIEFSEAEGIILILIPSIILLIIFSFLATKVQQLSSARIDKHLGKQARLNQRTKEREIVSVEDVET